MLLSPEAPNQKVYMALKTLNSEPKLTGTWAWHPCLDEWRNESKVRLGLQNPSNVRSVPFGYRYSKHLTYGEL